jgi:hypothetical protein
MSSHFRCKKLSHIGCFNISPLWSAWSIWDKIWVSPNRSFEKTLKSILLHLVILAKNSRTIFKIIDYNVIEIYLLNICYLLVSLTSWRVDRNSQRKSFKLNVNCKSSAPNDLPLLDMYESNIVLQPSGIDSI